MVMKALSRAVLMTKPNSNWTLNSEIDIDNPDPELAAFASDDTTTADFDLDANGELSSHVRSADLVVDMQGFKLLSGNTNVTPLSADLEPRFRDWTRAVRQIVADQKLDRITWPGTMTVTGTQVTWEPDLNEAKGNTELLDKALADVWLLHNS